MKKVNWHLAERKMNQGIKAGQSFWDRIINDPDSVKVKRKIQAQYGLPVPYDIRLNNSEWIKWMGYEEDPTSERAKRGQALRKDVDVLLEKFDIPKKWYFEFFAEIAGESLGHADMSSSSQFPEMKISKNKNGTWTWTCIITPETDLDNPLTLYVIQREQKIYAGDPPKPTKDKRTAVKRIGDLFTNGISCTRYLPLPR